VEARDRKCTRPYIQYHEIVGRDVIALHRYTVYVASRFTQGWGHVGLTSDLAWKSFALDRACFLSPAPARVHDPHSTSASHISQTLSPPSFHQKALLRELLPAYCVPHCFHAFTCARFRLGTVAAPLAFSPLSWLPACSRLSRRYKRVTRYKEHRKSSPNPPHSHPRPKLHGKRKSETGFSVPLHLRTSYKASLLKSGADSCSISCQRYKPVVKSTL
jgi:hypothetical protein